MLESTATGRTPDTPLPAHYAKVQALVKRLPSRPSNEKALWRNLRGQVNVLLEDIEVSSHFTPVQSAVDLEPIGHFAQATTAPGDHKPLHFEHLEDEQHVAYDRLLRALHTLNYFRQVPHPHQLLFLNVHQRFLSLVSSNHGQAFRAILDSFEIPATQVVLQIVGEQALDLNLWALASSNYRLHGFKIGLHAHSPTDAQVGLKQIAPDYLSVDAGWNDSELNGLAERAWSGKTHLIARNSSSPVEADRVFHLGIPIQTPVNLTQSWRV